MDNPHQCYFLALTTLLFVMWHKAIVLKVKVAIKAMFTCWDTGMIKRQGGKFLVIQGTCIYSAHLCWWLNIGNLTEHAYFFPMLPHHSLLLHKTNVWKYILILNLAILKFQTNFKVTDLFVMEAKECQLIHSCIYAAFGQSEAFQRKYLPHICPTVPPSIRARGQLPLLPPPLPLFRCACLHEVSYIGICTVWLIVPQCLYHLLYPDK
jgi:hypothetical protein